MCFTIHDTTNSIIDSQYNSHFDNYDCICGVNLIENFKILQLMNHT